MPGTKRQAENVVENGHKKQRLQNHSSEIRQSIFEDEQLRSYTARYASSEPYRHGVIKDLVDPTLMRQVRKEIQDNVVFTPKETDIYKIHQSGDLANLDGLDNDSLSRLPSLLRLRDNLYSPAFRKCISDITGAGPLSGRKTDMAVNVYTPGCYLLCHDDVIGTRRVSYILYLTDPDLPWKAEWGGGLRLYPTLEQECSDGTKVKVPSPRHSVRLDPSFNQLSFFTVQPGESFHDVEEVYGTSHDNSAGDADNPRIRMAISGWYHIPQEGEEGYEKGLEEELAKRSSLAQLKGHADEFELPKARWQTYNEKSVAEGDPSELTEADLDLLLQFIAPQYLTPDTVEELSDRFSEDSSLQLSTFLSPKFAEKLFYEMQRTTQTWQGIASPPHKHRYLYYQNNPADKGPTSDLLQTLLASNAFKKWLQLITGNPIITRNNILARAFRRGEDYTLATGYAAAEPRLELCLGLTPEKAWFTTFPSAANGKFGSKTGEREAEEVEAENHGGQQIYMAGDDDDDDDNDEGEDSKDVDCAEETRAQARNGSSSNGAGGSKDDGEKATTAMTGAGKRRKADPAVYRSGEAQQGEEQDDGILFVDEGAWNTLSVVLRDGGGVLRFVKYLSRAAEVDRWDVLAEYEVGGWADDDDDDDDDEGEEEGDGEDVDEGGGDGDDDDKS